MFKKKYLGLAIAATLAAGSAQAALETSVTLKNETATMVKDGLRTGEKTTESDTTGEGKGVYKFENTAKIYLNDTLENGSSWHGELNIVRDSKAIDDYQGHETNTQRDWLRELYMDTTLSDWDVRIGKQQVVWGTADGIKLLDMINPTDWSEFNQNAPADARIPVWMINAEKYLDNGDNVQLILSEAGTNKIAGFNSSGDHNHPFIMKGVDTLTGNFNGFMNIGPALGKVAAFFASGGQGLSTLVATAANGKTGTQNLDLYYNDDTVYEFVNDISIGRAIWDGTNGYSSIANYEDFRPLCGGSFGASTGATAAGAKCEAVDLDAIVEGSYGQNSSATNLIDANYTLGATAGNAKFDVTDPNSMIEYMDQATFATFSDFVNMTTEWKVEDPEGANFGFRYKGSTADGVNYSINYMYAYDANPYIDLKWTHSTGDLTVSQSTVNNTVSLIKNDGNALYVPTDGAATLVMTQKQAKTNNLGGSLDFAIDTETMGPVVIRGEALYTQGAKQAVIDRAYLRTGNITEAFKSEDADTFKYVIGADVNVLTDMMVSGQFIQFRNLDYVDTTTTLNNVSTGVSGSDLAGASTFTGAKYSADMATMSLTNGLQKAEENKNFYSLFLTKPFGESGEGRWGNIFIFEEGGGKWNRFDVEYGINDQLIGTFEYNKYFGDENTMFGQFENASNIQIGLKYLLQ